MRSTDTIDVLKILLESAPMVFHRHCGKKGNGAKMKPVALTQTLGWRVEYLRDHVNGWTQNELAERLSRRLHRAVSQGYVSKIEKNHIDPPSKVVAALAREFNVNGEYLLDAMSDDPTPQKSAPDTDIFLSEEAGTAESIIDSLQPTSRQEMVRMLTLAAENEKQAREERRAYYDKLMAIVKEELGEEAQERLEKSIVASVAGSDLGAARKPIQIK